MNPSVISSILTKKFYGALHHIVVQTFCFFTGSTFIHDEVVLALTLSVGRFYDLDVVQ